MKYIKYLGFILLLVSILIGTMIDCNNLSENIETAVSSSFLSFILGMTLLCYIDDKSKSK